MEEALRVHRHPLSVANDTLRGTGGAWLLQHAKAATVVTLGESHGTREIPAIMEALFAELQAAGELDHLALEVSPWSARLMTNRLRAGPGPSPTVSTTTPRPSPSIF